MDEIAKTLLLLCLIFIHNIANLTNFFIAFATEDRDVRDKLVRQMNLVKDREGWNIWSSHEIKAGADWSEEIQERLGNSGVIIMLLSADFFNSKYILEIELPAILAKHSEGVCHIIPVIARECLWKHTAFGHYASLGSIQALPLGEKPIVSKNNWDNDDSPYVQVATGIKDSVEHFWQKKEQLKQSLDKEYRQQHKIAEHQKQEDATRKLNIQIAEQEAHDTEWKSAFKRDNIRTYELFLKTYPNSANAHNARNRIEALQKTKRNPIKWITGIMWVGIAVGVFVVSFVVWVMNNKRGKVNLDHPAIIANAPDSSKITTNILLKKTALTIEKIGDLDYSMVFVEGGTYTMGQPNPNFYYDGGSADECPHNVTLASFKIGQTEVTQAQWAAIMGKKDTPANSKGDNLPMENITWNQVQVFIKKLNEKTDRRFRLPTEEEWEYAARGGKDSWPKNNVYAGSNNLGEVAWYTGNSNNTHAVSTKKANELGLYDMSGNVWEWCNDKYTAYPGCTKIKDAQDRHIFRGGSFFSERSQCRTSVRSGASSSLTDNYQIGFRLAHD